MLTLAYISPPRQGSSRGVKRIVDEHVITHKGHLSAWSCPQRRVSRAPNSLRWHAEAGTQSPTETESGPHNLDQTVGARTYPYSRLVPSWASELPEDEPTRVVRSPPLVLHRLAELPELCHVTDLHISFIKPRAKVHPPTPKFTKAAYKRQRLDHGIC